MNREEQAFHFLVDEYMEIPKEWENYQIIKNAIEENKKIKEENEQLKIQLENRTKQYEEVWEKACNIDALRNWLEEQIEFVSNIPTFKKEIDINHKTQVISYNYVLDKLNELEGKND